MSAYLQVEMPIVECPYCGQKIPFTSEAEGAYFFKDGERMSNISTCPNCSRDFGVKAMMTMDFSCQTLKIQGAEA